MFDSIFDNIFFLIPIAIIIGRVVIQAKKKQQAPPPAPKIPVHFEDDEGAEGAAVLRLPKAALKKPRKIKRPPAIPVEAPGVSRGNAVPAEALAQEAPAPVKSAPVQNDFAFNLNHLSPLKQAVIMAEVLGPPKGIQ